MSILFSISNEYMIFIWLAIVIVCLAIEAMTTELVSIYFSFGGIVGMILSAAHVAFWPQIWIYLAIVAITLFSTRSMFLKYLKKNEVKTNVDSIVGRRYKLQKAITSSYGELSVSGVVWNAITNDNTEIEVDSLVEVISINGTKLIVKKID